MRTDLADLLAQDLSYREIARRLGTTVGVVAGQVARSKRIYPRPFTLNGKIYPAGAYHFSPRSLTPDRARTQSQWNKESRR